MLKYLYFLSLLLPPLSSSTYESPNGCDMDADFSEAIVSKLVAALPMCVYSCFIPAGINLIQLSTSGTLPECYKTKLLVNCSRKSTCRGRGLGNI